MRRKPQTNDYSLLYERAARERDEARAGAARWKAEADRLREQASHCPSCPHCDPCQCVVMCGDSDPDGPGVCRDLPRAPSRPLVEIVVVPRAGGGTDA